MKAVFVYVDAGKGHYIPAKALSDSFGNAGCDTELVELFSIFGRCLWKSFIKYDWRICLHHPWLEVRLHKATDSKRNNKAIKMQIYLGHRIERFREWYEREKPDFIVSTHFLGGVLLPILIKHIGADCPVFQYAPDIFDIPKAGVSDDVEKMYIASKIGAEHMILSGESRNRTSVCPFPLQRSFETAEKLSKADARKKLGLKDKFTILINLGGEGIGTSSILYGLARRGLDVQVVVIGGHNSRTSYEYDRFQKDYPDFDLVRAGFVDNVPDYLSSSDMQYGKTGANALMEAMYMYRPCLISDVLYMARSISDFFASYPVGWCENAIDAQLDIIQSLYDDPALLDDIDAIFQQLPFQFGADLFRAQIMDDYEKWKNVETESTLIHNSLYEI